MQIKHTKIYQGMTEILWCVCCKYKHRGTPLLTLPLDSISRLVFWFLQVWLSYQCSWLTGKTVDLPLKWPQKEMATYRHWSVSLWRDPDDVSHCRILSPDKTEAYLGYTLWMRTLFRGWPIMVNETHTRRRRLLLLLCVTYFCCSACRTCGSSATSFDKDQLRNFSPRENVRVCWPWMAISRYGSSQFEIFLPFYVTLSYARGWHRHRQCVCLSVTWCIDSEVMSLTSRSFHHQLAQRL